MARKQQRHLCGRGRGGRRGIKTVTGRTMTNKKKKKKTTAPEEKKTRDCFETYRLRAVTCLERVFSVRVLFPASHHFSRVVATAGFQLDGARRLWVGVGIVGPAAGTLRVILSAWPKWGDETHCSSGRQTGVKNENN